MTGIEPKTPGLCSHAVSAVGLNASVAHPAATQYKLCCQNPVWGCEGWWLSGCCSSVGRALNAQARCPRSNMRQEFLAFRLKKVLNMGSLLKERIFWSTLMEFWWHILSGCWVCDCGISVPLPCAVHINDCEGWWLSSCRSSVAEHWLHKPGVLGSIHGGCRPFSLSSTFAWKHLFIPTWGTSSKHLRKWLTKGVSEKWWHLTRQLG